MTRKKSIDDPQGTSNNKDGFQHLLWLKAKGSISEAEVEAFSTLNVYKLLLTMYVCLGKMKAAKN